ncbi:hypothetical protein WJ438_27090 [Streptomyces sp. GD-15H]|uniref:hypothetical protein n=1 Tax=Streptomyces sp. GD-15H TaxID=3129112 RepID=UPI003251B6AB
MAEPARAALGDVWLDRQVCRGGPAPGPGGPAQQLRHGVHEAGLADESATGLICWRCGYVHLFADKGIKLYRADK